MPLIEPVAIATITLLAVVGRPKDLNERLGALFGAALVLIFGLISLSRALSIELDSWNVFLFVFGMMGVAELADQSGVFDSLAPQAVRHARGSAQRLYLGVFLLGTLIAVLLPMIQPRSF